MFQFPIRNSVRSDQFEFRWRGTRWGLVSIPHSEFCSFGRLASTAFGSASGRFQFPIRNSVRSDQGRREDAERLRSCFNSPFGILFVRTFVVLVRFSPVIGVSIPHSEFCSFGLPRALKKQNQQEQFQFPIRNSVRSDPGLSYDEEMLDYVSIPHSEFCSFGPAVEWAFNTDTHSFNSPFGILFVRTVCRGELPTFAKRSFNSPFGILFVRTKTPSASQKTAK